MTYMQTLMSMNNLTNVSSAANNSQPALLSSNSVDVAKEIWHGKNFAGNIVAIENELKRQADELKSLNNQIYGDKKRPRMI